MKVLLVDADLLAKARVLNAAAVVRAEIADAESSSGDVFANGYDLVIVDLDRGRAGALSRLADARAAGRLDGVRIVGYLSHVDEELRAAAEAAGCEAMPRGRFFKSLPRLLGSLRPAD